MTPSVHRELTTGKENSLMKTSIKTATSAQPQYDLTKQMPMVSMIWQAMCGSGALTGIRMTTIERK